MTAEQKQLVQESFKQILPIKEQAASLFYERLFLIDPAVRGLFKGDIKRQGSLLMAMLATAVNGLNRLDDIVPAVQDLGRRHAGYGVQEEHYTSVATALLWTLEQGLGNAWTPQLKDAWVACYTLLAGAMQQAATQGKGRTSAS